MCWVTAIATDTTDHIWFNKAFGLLGTIILPMTRLATDAADVVISKGSVHEG